MGISRRSILGLIGLAPFVAKEVMAGTLEAMPPAPLDKLPVYDVLPVYSTGSVISTGNIPKLLWPGLNEIYGKSYRHDVVFEDAA